MDFKKTGLATCLLFIIYASPTGAQEDDEIKGAVLKYELAKKYQAEYELTVERARKCSATWLYFRSLAVVTDELAKYNEDFSFKTTDWLSLHWMTTMEVMESFGNEPDISKARTDAAKTVDGWDFDTKMAWAGICHVKEADRVAYDPALMQDFPQPGQYDENGNPIQ